MNAELSRIALVGSPNSGKTTLFNALTGSRQKTGNYAGVTVEKKEGLIELKEGFEVALLDLPGAYSLDARTPDEAITAEMVRGSSSTEPSPHVVIAVADSTNLERNLYLVFQLKELGVPMVLALTMSDLAQKRGIEVKREELERRLGIPVIVTSAVKGRGLDELKSKVDALLATKPGLLEKPSIDNSPQRILNRYQLIEDTVRAVLVKKSTAKDVTRALDRVLLHKLAGPLILFVAFAAMFQLIFTFAELPMGMIEAGVAKLQDVARGALPPGDFQSLVVDGAIAGVGSVVVFLPQIILLFTFILLFEDSGYMARAAFILDRLMARVGLNGRAFIPLLSSFACAIPGIMATRTIEHRRERLITILVSPLMTCSARIPVYTLLIAAFVPQATVLGFLSMQGLVMLGLYLFGIVAALVVAAVLKRTALKGQSSAFLMELPTYKVPSLRNLLLGLYDRAKIFLRRAGTIILAVSIVLWALATYPKATPPAEIAGDEKAVAAYQLEHSFAGRAGHLIEPVIRPLGYDWKIGIGLLSSFAAREVVLSTLGTVYAIGYDEDNSEALSDQLKKSFGLATALSLLVFYALACQCISTIAVTRRETNSWRWPAVMFIYMTLLAYGSSALTYNVVNLLTAN